MDMDKAMRNPGSVFGTPEVISASCELTPNEKRAVLLQWKDQLLQLQAADEEGMQKSEAGAGATADLLRRVVSVYSRIDAELKRGHLNST